MENKIETSRPHYQREFTHQLRGNYGACAGGVQFRGEFHHVGADDARARVVQDVNAINKRIEAGTAGFGSCRFRASRRGL